MAIIKPFPALRPVPTLASAVASLPYDVMNTEEAKEMAAGNPRSFLHVSRPEIDLPASIDIHAPEVYSKAAENFQAFIQNGTLKQDDKPCLYVYAQIMNGREQIGLVACSSVEDYFDDVIKKHEYTRPEKEQDRIEHMEAVKAHVGPIFLTYKPNETVRKIIERVITTKPENDFTSADDITHKVWVISDDADITAIVTAFQKEISYTYIADGHHRTASAAKVGKKLHGANPKHTGNEEYNFFLSVLFPSDELAIMDYNRLVKDLNGLSKEDFLKKVPEKFTMETIEADNAKPSRLHDFAMYIDGQWYRLIAKKEIYTENPIGVLDVTILQNNILAPLLGITDPRIDQRIDFVGGIRGLKQLQKRVDSGEMAVAFALFPVSLPQLMNIADSGNVMPPKSTWFEPKLRDGLFSHLF
jgi:uncharacterized protein (DUF1015 family)